MEFTSDLEGEIGVQALRTSRAKLESNSDLEGEITSDLQGEIGIPRAKVRIAQGEIEIHFGPGGRNHLGPRAKPLRTWGEIT